MNQGERAFLHTQLVEANRALITLGALDFREKSPLISPALRDCMQVYTQLLECQRSLSLSEEEATGLDSVLARLKVYLRHFGEDV